MFDIRISKTLLGKFPYHIQYLDEKIIYLHRVNHVFYISSYRFIYTGEVFVPQHELKDFLRTAELLEIKGLLKVNNITISNSGDAILYCTVYYTILYLPQLIFKDADDPAWSGLSSLFQPSPIGQSPLIQQNQQQGAPVTNQQLLAAAQVASAATSPTSILAGNLAAAAAAAQQQNVSHRYNRRIFRRLI